MTGSLEPLKNGARNLHGSGVWELPLTRRLLNGSCSGEMPERSNGAVSKTVVGVTPPRVRIPVSPPLPSKMLIFLGD